MKILFVTYSLRRGGAERQLAELAFNLTDRGHEVTVASAYPGDPYEDVLRAKGVKILNLLNQPRNTPVKRPLWKRAGRRLMMAVNLGRLLARTKADVIYGFGREPNVDITILKFVHRRPVVWGIRNSSLPTRHPISILEGRVSKFANLIIPNSYAGRDVLRQRGFPVERITVIENGIDTNRFGIDIEARDAVRRTLGIGGENVVGIVARLDPVKNHEMFLEAASYVQEAEPNTRFLIVGRSDNGRQDILAKYSKELGLDDSVLWLGERRDVERYINAMDVCVLCSDREGFPNAVAEALACGVPCVVTDAGDSARLIDHHERVVPPRDADALARSIVETLRQKSSLDRSQLRDGVLVNWSVNRLAERTESALQKVCSG